MVGGAALLVGVAVLSIVVSVLGNVGLSVHSNYLSVSREDSAISTMQVPPSSGYSNDGFAVGSDMAYARPTLPVPSPEPMQPYVPNLEAYETTDYRVHARTRDFDAACSLLHELKADEAIHFRSLSEHLNRCSAVFFVDEERADAVRDRLVRIDGASVERSTESVTRMRENIINQVDVLRQQLAHTEATLADVTEQYATITDLAYSEGEPATLNRTVQAQFEILDNLNQRRLRQSNQLKNLLQQSTDLEERIGKTMFDVSLNRSNPIEPGKYAQQWERALEDLQDRFIATLIGFTAYLGIFLLWGAQIVLYGLIVLFVARFLWKVARVVWKN